MADNFDQQNNNNSRDDVMSWIPTLIMLVCFAPVGLVMLLVKLFGQSGISARGTHPYDDARQRGRQAAHEARDSARQAAHVAQETARQATHVAQETARQAAHEAQETARQAAQEVRQTARQVARETQDAVRQATGELRDAGRQAAQEMRRPAQQVGAEIGRPPRQAQRPAQDRPARKPAPPKLDPQTRLLHKLLSDGRALTMTGGILAAIFGMGALGSLFDALGTGGLSHLLRYSMGDVFFPLGFCGGGLVMLYYGLTKAAKAKRFRKYLALIGKRDSIAVSSLAQAMGLPLRRTCSDLQDMLDAGLFPTGFLDVGCGRLILSGEGLQEDEAPVAPKPEAPVPKGMEREDAVLGEIRQVNDAISDLEMSRKIDRIGEITGKIFVYLREKPGREDQLRSFLSYYLPTTLKILRAYAQMESQGIEGENITAAKARIEGMMDKVVDGFEKQLDKLFQDDAMDITSDVAVLERMLDKDGLGGSEGLRLGG